MPNAKTAHLPSSFPAEEVEVHQRAVLAVGVDFVGLCKVPLQLLLALPLVLLLLPPPPPLTLRALRL